RMADETSGGARGSHRVWTNGRAGQARRGAAAVGVQAEQGDHADGGVVAGAGGELFVGPADVLGQIGHSHVDEQLVFGQVGRQQALEKGARGNAALATLAL